MRQIADPSPLIPPVSPETACQTGIAEFAQASLSDAGIRQSRWPARLTRLQNLSGLCLVFFLMAHLIFVSSLLISLTLLRRVACFFQGEWLFGQPYPIPVSLLAAGITCLLVLHAWLALRRLPAAHRRQRAFGMPKNRLRPTGNSLWWLQILTGCSLFFLTAIHLYDMLNQPALSGPYESASHGLGSGMWPIYLMLLFTAELHGGIALYRLAIKSAWFAGALADIERRRLRRMRHGLTAFFMTLGLLTLLACIDLGQAHAELAGESRALPGNMPNAAVNAEKP